VRAPLFAPGLAGRVPLDSGLEALVAAVVNIHHFVLDGAIWKLRDGRIARILIRSGQEPVPVGSGSGVIRRRWSAAPLVWVVGAACVLVIVLGTLESEFGLHRAAERRDPERMAQAVQRLAWLGRDSANARTVLGVLRAQAGDWEEGIRDVKRSLSLYPTAKGWDALGQVYVEAGEPELAIRCYRTALARSPGMSVAENDLAWLRATHPDPRVRDSGEAVALAEETARATGYAQPTVLDTLAAAYASASRFRQAQRVAARARELAIASGDADLADEIEARRQLYAARQPYRDTVPAGGRASTATSGYEGVRGPEGTAPIPPPPESPR
jgi:Tfp pilus assembly protein PilF